MGNLDRYIGSFASPLLNRLTNAEDERDQLKRELEAARKRRDHWYTQTQLARDESWRRQLLLRDAQEGRVETEAQAQAALDAFEKECERLKSELSLRQTAITGLNARLDNQAKLLANYGKLIDQMKKDKAALQDRNDKQYHIIEDLKRRNGNQAQTHKNLCDEIERLNLELKDLRAKNKAFTAALGAVNEQLLKAAEAAGQVTEECGEF